MWWRRTLKRLRWMTADRVALIVLSAVWWFLLRPHAAVVGAVDSVSYLAAIWSAWRMARSTVSALRSGRAGAVGGEVAESRQRRGHLERVGGDPAERVGERGVAAGEQGSGR
jgi:hypothetical protein